MSNEKLAELWRTNLKYQETLKQLTSHSAEQENVVRRMQISCKEMEDSIANLQSKNFHLRREADRHTQTFKEVEAIVLKAAKLADVQLDFPEQQCTDRLAVLLVKIFENQSRRELEVGKLQAEKKVLHEHIKKLEGILAKERKKYISEESSVQSNGQMTSREESAANSLPEVKSQSLFANTTCIQPTPRKRRCRIVNHKITFSEPVISRTRRGSLMEEERENLQEKQGNGEETSRSDAAEGSEPVLSTSKGKTLSQTESLVVLLSPDPCEMKRQRRAEKEKDQSKIPFPSLQEEPVQGTSSNQEKDTAMAQKEASIAQNFIEVDKENVKPALTNQASPSRTFPKPIEKPSPRVVKFEEPVRKKDERQSLPGHTCQDCERFVKALTDGTENGVGKEQLLLNKCSRHRRKHAAPQTPEGYWSFPSLELSPPGSSQETI